MGNKKTEFWVNWPVILVIVGVFILWWSIWEIIT